MNLETELTPDLDQECFCERVQIEWWKITVPLVLWKVILVLPREDAEPRKNTRVIAVIMPNDQSVGFDWAKYRTSARDVEKPPSHAKPIICS